MKKVLIASYERSGTHFLMNALELNFGYNAKVWVDLDEAVPNPFNPNDMVKALKFITAMKDKDIVKTHYAVEFLQPLLELLLEFYHVFYIWRNMADVMNSLCKHLNDIEWNEGPKVKDGDELALSEPCGGLMRYQYRQYPTMMDRWEAHVSGWEGLPKKIANQIVYIKFADLKDNFNNTIFHIAKRIGKTCLAPVYPSKIIQVVRDGAYIEG